MADRARHDSSRIEPIAAVIISVATVLIAWSAFQNTAWAGEVAALGRQAGAARTESAKDLASLNRDLIGDQVLFTTYLLALDSGNEDVAEAIAGEFRPDFAVLVDKWQEAGGASPFDRAEYTVREEIEAATRHTIQAEEAGDAATIATEHRNDYAAATVLLAVVLFVVATGKNFTSEAIQKGSIVLGSVILFGVAVWVLNVPKVL